MSIAEDAELAFPKDENRFTDALKSADVLLTFPADFPANFSDKAAPKLGWIHTMSAGVDRFMVPGLVNSGIILTNSSGIHAIPIAEHVLGMILSFERNLHLSRDYQSKKEWHRFEFGQMSELRGKTAAVYGLGEIGLRISKILKAFEVKVIGIKREKTEKPELIDKLYSINDADSALPIADYVIICLPYTKETRHMFDANRLSKMKRGAVIINIGRGGIVDEDALIGQLTSGSLKGAGLDVFEQEPLPVSSPFYSMPNVIVTPHVSGATPHYIDRATKIFCENLRHYLNKEPMTNVVDKRRGY
ncbi:MAG: D-2-hydroxyacid dehydrogenase [Candidatus Aenigmarchaeota archaeon]|nr:D-2-hydroxyacid dehydrogenase [Candidatus Aenigmarchaeota archaeon]